MPGPGQSHPGGVDNPDYGPGEDTGPIPAVGIPDKYQRICEWGDTPIYCCQHCRDRGIFDPKRFNFLGPEELPSRCVSPEKGPAATQAPRVTGPFLSDFEVRKILERMGVEMDRDPVNDAFLRGRFGKGGHTRYTRSELRESD